MPRRDKDTLLGELKGRSDWFWSMSVNWGDDWLKVTKLSWTLCETEEESTFFHWFKSTMGNLPRDYPSYNGRNVINETKELSSMSPRII